MDQLKHIRENRTLLKAGAITLIAYLLFSLLARPDIKPLPRHRIAPLRITYIPRQTAGGLEEMYDLWSPVLFSFPNEQGFSAAFLNSHNFETEATRRDVARLDQFLAAPLSTPEPATLRLAPTAAATLKLSGNKPVSVFNPPRAKPAGIQFKATHPLAERLIATPDLSALQESNSWQRAASLTVSPDGLVTHAFIEPVNPPAPPVSAAIIRSLYLLRFQPSEQETQGQIIIYSWAAAK